MMIQTLLKGGSVARDSLPRTNHLASMDRVLQQKNYTYMVFPSQLVSKVGTMAHLSKLQGDPLVVTAIIAGLLIITLVGRIISSNYKLRSRPPGPPGNIIFGNAFDAPTVKPWDTWGGWKKEYGPIVSLNVFGQLIVMLNTPELIHQLFEKQSAISSDRPKLVLLGDIVGLEDSTVILPYGAKHREARKLFNQAIGKGNVSKFNPLVEAEMLRLVLGLMNAKGREAIVANIRHRITAVILSVTYGITIDDNDDTHLREAELAMKPFDEGLIPGAFLVDTIPILKYVPAWFPGASWRRIANTWARSVHNFVNNPISIVKKELEAGIHKNSMVHELLSAGQSTEHAIKWAAMTMHIGGSDTSVAGIETFLLAMTLNPDIQRKAQAEVDAIIGQDRLPNLNDRPSLPYVGALMNEVQRWHPVSPFGAPHRITEDEMFEGYGLPKGTVVFGNIWGIMHDEKYFSRPSEFLPERFLHSDKKDKDSPTALLEPWNFVFGFGRRVCPGRDLAVMELWLTIALCLATVNISKARDEQGNVDEPTVEFTSGVISHPFPFNCVIEPRSSKAASLLRDAVSYL